MTVEISYSRSVEYRDYLPEDPRTISVDDFQFRVFLGSVSLIIDGQDLSPEPDWIPLVGFSTNLCWAISSALSERPGVLLLMENDDQLTFTVSGESMRVSTNYSDKSAVCNRNELLEEARRFAAQVFSDFAQKNPQAGLSTAYERLWLHAGLGRQDRPDS